MNDQTNRATTDELLRNVAAPAATLALILLITAAIMMW
jgi:hypothetical protein